MPHVRWIDEDEASGKLAEIYHAWRQANPSRAQVPEILKCFSIRPDFLDSVIEFSDSLHFSDGFLTCRTKEMIATFVSGLNRCPY